MPDYIYLLENRLSADQRNALRLLRDAAGQAGMILFLTGDAVRDLTSGHAVRELEVSVHGDSLKLKKFIEKSGGQIWGQDETSKTLYLCFSGTVRVDLISAHRVDYPKPGKPVYHAASIQEDLRRRDFTANAMAISLNEGSFGLLMDPLNGAADIESRTLRLVSNYGFLEEPALLIRATRYRARLGWELDPRTLSRYENAKMEGMIEHLSAHARSEELEQIGHEEDGLKVLEAFEAEGWMKVLFSAWTPAKADLEGLKSLRELAVELLMQGVHPDMSAAQMELLTAKLAPKDLGALKKLMLRPGFVEEWNSLDSLASGFAKALMAKTNQTPSSIFKLFTSYDPEAVLWLGFTTKDSAIRERSDNFLKVWPEARQRIPHAMMLEMRITPELPGYGQLVESIFLELIDGKLTTQEETRAFLEPHSPPAPPPQVTFKRQRARRGAEPKFKETSIDEEEGEEGLEEESLDEMGGDGDEMDLTLPRGDAAEHGEESDSDEEETEEGDEEEAERPAAAKREAKNEGGAARRSVVAPHPPVAKTLTNLRPVPAPESKTAKQPEVAKLAAPAKEQEKQKPAPQAKPDASAGKSKFPLEAASAKTPAASKQASAPAKPGKSVPQKSTRAAAQAKPAAKPGKKTAPSVKAPVKAAAKHPVAKTNAKAKPSNGAKTQKSAKPSKLPAKKSPSKTKKKR
jgi:tRNA nucleotidyltransferase (CCA-adding enzyme)